MGVNSVYQLHKLNQIIKICESDPKKVQVILTYPDKKFFLQNLVFLLPWPWKFEIYFFLNHDEQRLDEKWSIENGLDETVIFSTKKYNNN